MVINLQLSPHVVNTICNAITTSISAQQNALIDIQQQAAAWEAQQKAAAAALEAARAQMAKQAKDAPLPEIEGEGQVG